jgi:hypothetical protein
MMPPGNPASGGGVDKGIHVTSNILPENPLSGTSQSAAVSLDNQTQVRVFPGKA